MGRLTVKKPRKHAPKEHVSLIGKGKPGTKITVKGLRDGLGRPKEMRATVGKSGKWGVSGMAPMKIGVHTISAKSTDATTSTTFAVRVPGKPPRKRK
jgi:hypothetical protein